MRGWRDVLVEKGPAGFAKAVRQHKGLLITDTTMRYVLVTLPVCAR